LQDQTKYKFFLYFYLSISYSKFIPVPPPQIKHSIFSKYYVLFVEMARVELASDNYLLNTCTKLV